MMNTETQRPNGRPKLFPPLALTPQATETGSARFPLSPHQLRRTVAEMIG